MKPNRIRTVSSILALMALTLALPMASSGQQYQPTPGQPGKDVIWVPTPPELIAAMLDMAKVTPSDYVIDLGSGDGRIVIAAAKRGARAMGVEYNPDMVELSKENAQKEGVYGKATFVRGDIFQTDFSQATVLTMYLLPDLNLKLRPMILNMKPGTRVVTNTFDMDNWKPDQSISVGGRTGYFWIVPAHVAGTWTWKTGSGSAELNLTQTFQEISGSLKINGKEATIRDAKLTGAQISFSAADGTGAIQEYSGTINGETIQGTSHTATGTNGKWTAARRVSK